MSWYSEKLGSSALEIIDGDRGTNYPNKEEFSAQGYCLFLNTKNVLKNGFDFSNTMFISKEKDEKLRKGKIEKNDVVLTTRGTIGNVGIFDDSVVYRHIRINSGMLIFRPELEVFYPKYLFWVMRSNSIQTIFKTVASGCAQPQLPIRSLKDILIPLPPLPIQKKIAEVLDKADELRQIKKKTIEKLDQLIQSIFLDMFGDPVTNPKGWDVKKLGDVCSKITDGVHFKPNYIEHGIPFISVKDITTGTLYFDNCKFISKEDHEKYIKRCKPEKDDILYTKVGATYGRPAIIDADIDFSIYVSVSLIKPLHDLINSRYLNITMANPAIKRQADKSIKGIGVPDLHLNMIREFLIPLPPMDIQEQFVIKIEIINNLKSQHKQALFKFDNLFNSLMQRAFKGDLQFKD